MNISARENRPLETDDKTMSVILGGVVVWWCGGGGVSYD